MEEDIPRKCPGYLHLYYNDFVCATQREYACRGLATTELEYQYIWVLECVYIEGHWRRYEMIYDGQ